MCVCVGLSLRKLSFAGRCARGESPESPESSPGSVQAYSGM